MLCELLCLKSQTFDVPCPMVQEYLDSFFVILGYLDKNEAFPPLFRENFGPRHLRLKNWAQPNARIITP